MLIIDLLAPGFNLALIIMLEYDFHTSPHKRENKGKTIVDS